MAGPVADLQPIRNPISREGWRRLPDRLSPKRGRDQNDVSDIACVDINMRVTPRELALLDKAAAKAGLARATFLRRMIRALEVTS